jgi:hypothetical protein
MKKKLTRRFFVLLSIISLFYVVFYVIFFFFLASLSVDGLIGFSIIFLFCVFYRFGGVHVDRFFLSISKNIWLYFVTLISLTFLIKQLFINVVRSFKNILIFQIVSNYLVFFELGNVLNDLNEMLLNKHALNIVLFEILYKQIVIKNLFEKTVTSNEVVFFLQNFIDLNVYYSYNTVGWLR